MVNFIKDVLAIIVTDAIRFGLFMLVAQITCVIVNCFTDCNLTITPAVTVCLAIGAVIYSALKRITDAVWRKIEPFFDYEQKD